MLGVGQGGPLGTDAVIAPLRQPAASRPRRLAERDALAVLATVDGIGPVTFARLVDRLGDARGVLEAAAGRNGLATIYQASRDERASVPRRMTEEAGMALVAAAEAPGSVLDRLEAAGLTWVTLVDHDYPPRLGRIDLPPHVLFLRGDRSALSAARAVAVVGTRRPSEKGRLVASRIAGALARAGAAVVSGLAVGIDGAAHAAAITERGLTVAVLGGGHGRLFPAAHRRLVRTIVETGGAVVSEYAPKVEASRGTFPRRNRIISGLAEATVVVEAGADSGSLITASWALEQGRECFLVPGTIDSRTAAGCLSFLREFSGQARIVAGVPQLLEDLDLVTAGRQDGPPLPRSAAVTLAELGPTAERIAGELLAGRTTADELVAATGLSIATVLGALTLLESSGLAAGAYGRYRAVGPLATAPERR